MTIQNQMKKLCRDIVKNNFIKKDLQAVLKKFKNLDNVNLLKDCAIKEFERQFTLALYNYAKS